MVTGLTTGFLASPSSVTIALFFTLSVFFVLGRFVDLDFLETNDVYRRKADLEIPVSKLYDMMDIN
jgi:hypothetical protein